ncbi:MAG TPA: cytochrome c [Candidatus Heimdallarchaeota archaeon]|nr:cytochrome c [Candidatus Heimdallarchaeota archaeon]
MSFFIIKVILGTIFFLSGLGATFTMLILMGRAEKKTSPTTLRKLHKFFGFIFFLLLLVLAFMGMRHWSSVGDDISTRAVFHAILALALFIVFFTKVAIIQFFKQFLKMAPTLGLIVFCLSFVVFVISGKFYILRGFYSAPTAEITETITATEIMETSTAAKTQGRAGEGKKIFDSKCLPCHSPDTEERKIGPSLMGLLKKNSLPHTGNPATVENIKKQLIRPALTMPAFEDFIEQEVADIIAYLKTI